MVSIVCRLQARIQSSILEKLGKITMLDRIPAGPFETFALGRYEGRLHEALENGVIKQEQLKELTTEETVRQYVESQRQTLEQEFAVLMAVDEIFKREKLEVDESEIDSMIESQREEFKQAGKIATVRFLTSCIHRFSGAVACPIPVPFWSCAQLRRIWTWGGRVVQIDQVKEYIKSELQQRTTMEFLHKSSDITITPLAEDE